MESNIKASFIPDKMPAASRGGVPQQQQGGGSASDIVILVAVVMLAAALALAAGVFLYDRYLDANVQRKTEQLNRAQQAFEPELIKELVRLDARLQAANVVLSQHLAPSELFNLLEELTLQSISYNSFDYTIGEEGRVQMKLRGRARSVNGVALQASVFGQHNAVENPIFSDLDLVNNGVTFNVSATLNPSALRYTTVFTQYSAGIQGNPAGGNSDSSATKFDSFDSFESTTPIEGVDDVADVVQPEPNIEATSDTFGDFGSAPSDSGASQ